MGGQERRLSLSNLDKQEFVDLFSDVLKTVIQGQDSDKQSLLQNVKDLNLQTFTKQEIRESVKSKTADKTIDNEGWKEEKDQNEQLSGSDSDPEKDGDALNAEDMGSDDAVNVLRTKRATRKL